MRKPKRRPVKPEKKKPQLHSVHHEEYAPLVQEAFVANKIQYYTFKKDTDIRTGRYMIIQNLIQEVNLRMDLERLKMYLDRIESELNATRGSINVGNALTFIGQLKTMTQLAFEPDTVYRLASVMFFDETEDLRTWDKKYNESKIMGWKEDGTLDFFYNKPFRELIGLKDTSPTVLKDYLEKVAALSEGYKSVLSSEIPVL